MWWADRLTDGLPDSVCYGPWKRIEQSFVNTFFKIPHSCCIVTKDSIFIDLEQSFRSGIMRPLARFSIFSSYLYISFFHFLFLAFCPEWRLSRHLKADESLPAWRCSCIFFFLLFPFYVPIFLHFFIHSLIVIYLRFPYYNYYFIKKSSALWCALLQHFSESIFSIFL